MIKILSLSDLHLGDGSTADNFWIPNKKFLNFLKDACNKYDYVVLVGDIEDLLNAPIPYTDLQAYYSITRAHYDICVFIEEQMELGKIIYINGNHDSVIRTSKIYPLAKKHWSIGEGSQKVYFEHGHHGDVICHKFSWISRLGIWIGGLLDRFGIIDADIVWGWFAHYFPVGADADEGKFYNYIIKRGKEVEAKLFICGHTHKELEGSNSGVSFINCGAVVKQKEKFPVVEIEVPDSGIVQFEIKYVDITSLEGE
jgi:UDP-2,3-diacylglucosamine pyrophosphatase LpxH